MLKRLLCSTMTVLCLFTLTACKQTEPPAESGAVSVTPEPPAPPTAEELAALERMQTIDALASRLTTEEKVGQLLFVRVPTESAAEDAATYHLGGYVLFGRDFKDAGGNWLTEEQLTQNVQSYQAAAAADTGIPLLIGVDEEGGSVVRASANPNLFPSGKFHSPQWLRQHASDQSDIYAEDAREKNSALLRFGINVNLAPVCDVSTDPADFIYDRTLGQDAAATADYVKRVVTAMGDIPMGSVLKHFPGYGSNADTHTGVAVDTRPYETFVQSDFLPFSAGIAAGAGKTAVLVCHNIVQCMDAELPASLSPEVHRILRQELGFDGVVMTDDLAMDAVAAYAKGGSAAVLAVNAGNDLLITSDYRTQYGQLLSAVETGTISTETLDTAVRRVLAWKYDLGLLTLQ